MHILTKILFIVGVIAGCVTIITGLVKMPTNRCVQDKRDIFYTGMSLSAVLMLMGIGLKFFFN